MKITSKQDAYGQEVRAYWKGKDSYEIVERDDGFISLSGGPPVYFSEYKNWAPHEKKVMKLVRGKVLDVGCGAGRISLFLQKKGLDVTGIDNSPLAIRVCKERGLRKAQVMSVDDVRKFKPNSLDTILMFGNNFGLFGSFKKAKKLLRDFYKVTSDNARIIAESHSPYQTNDSAHRSYHQFNKKRGRMAGQLRLRVRFGAYIGPWFDYLIVSKKEMKDIVHNTGWKIKKFIDSPKSTYMAIIEKE